MTVGDGSGYGAIPSVALMQANLDLSADRPLAIVQTVHRLHHLQIDHTLAIPAFSTILRCVLSFMSPLKAPFYSSDVVTIQVMLHRTSQSFLALDPGERGQKAISIMKISLQRFGELDERIGRTDVR